MRPDARLVPVALGAWCAAWWAVGEPTPDPVGRVAWALGGLAIGAVAVTCVFHRTGPPGPVPRRVGRACALLACSCLTAASVLAVAAVDLAARGGCDVRAIAAAGGWVSVDAVVVGDPVPTTGFGATRWRRGLDVVVVEHRSVRCAVRTPLDVVGGLGPEDVVVGDTITTSGVLGEGLRGPELSADGLVVTAPAPALLRVVADVRADLLSATDGLSPQARGLVPGAAIGDTTRVPEEVTDAMLVTSLTHITAVSGGHVAVVVAAVAWCCGGLRLRRRARVLVAGAALTAFVLLVRPDPSVLRAAATGAVGLLALVLRRPAAAVPGLSAAVVVLLVLDPWLARSFGFVLSTVATAGLVTLAGPIARRIPGPRVLAFAVAVPVAAQLVCGPVLILLEPSVSVYAVPANLLACVALAPATILGLAATAVAPWWPAAATLIAWCAGLATGWIALVAQVFAALPGASLTWPEGLLGAAGLAVLTAVGVEGLRRAIPPLDERADP
ncbi:ComEC/Rec2-related protein [Paraoerskovia marina]|uniref:ComEC/Rec2-related protein n=1 Tax=Paraoerskovia marina TaxID=545619 RepID=A0A1H1RTT9_9CELL|nr:ComEC/Rec2 family competence protein [Paraoerskovia marina]SDS38956.1 ComEC/Rec2-related protein [Paraoerskovia marina]